MGIHFFIPGKYRMSFTPGHGSRLKNWWSKVSGTKRIYKHPRTVDPSLGKFYPAPQQQPMPSFAQPMPSFAQPMPSFATPTINNNTRRAANRRRRAETRRPSYQARENVDEEDTLEWRIAHNPNIQLTNSEYRRLSPNLKQLGWTSFRERTGWQEYETKWRLRTAENERRDLEGTLNWRVQHNPNISLSEEEYASLSPNLKRLGWTSYSVQSGRQEYHTKWRRRTAENERKALESSLNWRIEHDPSILLTRAQYKALTPAQKGLGWERISVQVNRQEYEYRWKRA